MMLVFHSFAASMISFRLLSAIWYAFVNVSGVALALVGVLIALLARVDEQKLMAGFVGLHLVAHQQIEVMIFHRAAAWRL